MIRAVSAADEAAFIAAARASRTLHGPWVQPPLDAPSFARYLARFDGSAHHGFLVEDSAIIRQNLIATLEEMLPVDVVGTAEDEQTAVQWMLQFASKRSKNSINVGFSDIGFRKLTFSPAFVFTNRLPAPRR